MIANDMGTIEYATFRYGTVEEENGLKNWSFFRPAKNLMCQLEIKCWRYEASTFRNQHHFIIMKSNLVLRGPNQDPGPNSLFSAGLATWLF